jgi:hypothetical protein
MRELNMTEIDDVSGGINGYAGAGAILTITGFLAAVSTAPVSVPVLVVAGSVAGGLAIAQWWASNCH